jgi:DNA oxidative demethylase
MRGIQQRPDGLVYQPELIDEADERSVVAEVERMPLREVQMRGQVARRTVLHFGFDYGYESWRLTPAAPLPESLEWLRERCADLAGVPAPSLAQILVTRYPPGAAIGWHRDAPMFGPTVVGVSLLNGCTMQFQRRGSDGSRHVYELDLQPRSGYVLSGVARSAWQHRIPPVSRLRYSITFRTVRNPAKWTADSAGS